MSELNDKNTTSDEADISSQMIDESIRKSKKSLKEQEENLGVSMKAKKKNPRVAPVFWGSFVLVMIFILYSLFFTSQATETFSWLLATVSEKFGWLYMVSVAFFFVVCLGIIISPWGRIKLGPDDSKPDYSFLSWFAMLFSAGMGIGLLYFGVYEPFQHYVVPPSVSIEPGSVEAANKALEITFLHWGFSAWGIYAIVGLALAYFAFRHHLPLTVRSILYPLLGERINGWMGHSVDIAAMIGTFFGIATTLGLGVMQINSGLNHLFGVPFSVGIQVSTIFIIITIATISVANGLDGGIKRLSEFNMLGAVALLLFVLFLGPTLFILQSFVQNIGGYVTNLLPMTFNMYAYEGLTGDGSSTAWMGSWTLFYWGWWISWSPFVGMFIARISRGRTMREFLLGVLFVPGLFTCFWMSTFGNSGIYFDVKQGLFSGLEGGIDAYVALFQFLECFPGTTVVSIASIILVVTFFVTSADSGSLVIDTIACGGSEEGPLWQRIFWTFFVGAIAAMLLVAGGTQTLQAIQGVLIASAVPFAIVMLLMCWSLFIALQKDSSPRLARAPTQAQTFVFGQIPWRERLGQVVAWPKRDKTIAYYNKVVRPTLDNIQAAFDQHVDSLKLNVDIKVSVLEDRDEDDNPLSVELFVRHRGAKNFRYMLTLTPYKLPSFAYVDIKKKVSPIPAHYYRVDVSGTNISKGYNVYGISSENLIHDILQKYNIFLTSLPDTPPLDIELISQKSGEYRTVTRN